MRDTNSKGFLDEFQYVCGGFPKPTSNSQPPAECQRIHLSAETIYLEIESDSTDKGLSPTRSPSTSAYIHKVVTCASDRLAINQRLTQPPP